MMPVSHEYVLFSDKENITRVSLAVALIDDYTGTQPIGTVKVITKKLGVQAIKNRTGFYIFADMADGRYTIQIKSEYYYVEEHEIEIPVSDPLNPVLATTLRPLPSYAFPSRATLIRGLVRDAQRNHIEGARVEVIGKKVETKTTNTGEFVLYFKGLTEDEIVVENTRRYVKGNGDRKIHVRVIYGTKICTPELDGVEEGMTTSFKSPITLD
jgi:hypothetical protein